MYFPADYQYAQARAALEREINRVWTGDFTPPDAAKAMADAIERMIEAKMKETQS